MTFETNLQLATGINCSETQFTRLMKSCLKEASSFDQFCRLYTAAVNSGDLYHLNAVSTVRCKALKKLVELADGVSECQRAVALAGFRNKRGKPYNPVMYQRAQDKLATLA